MEMRKLFWVTQVSHKYNFCIFIREIDGELTHTDRKEKATGTQRERLQ